MPAARTATDRSACSGSPAGPLREKYGRVLIATSSASVTLTRAVTCWCRSSAGPPVTPAGSICQPRSPSTLIVSMAAAMPPRFGSRARTSNVCPGTGAAINAGGANAAPGPVGSGSPAGCATAVSSMPIAELIASWNCRSFTSSTNRASRSFAAAIAVTRQLQSLDQRRHARRRIGHGERRHRLRHRIVDRLARGADGGFDGRRDAVEDRVVLAPHPGAGAPSHACGSNSHSWAGRRREPAADLRALEAQAVTGDVVVGVAEPRIVGAAVDAHRPVLRSRARRRCRPSSAATGAVPRRSVRDSESDRPRRESPPPPSARRSGDCRGHRARCPGTATG